jgi:hypothetical protein
MNLLRLRRVWLVTATMGLAACAPPTAQDKAPSSTSTIAASTTVVEDIAEPTSRTSESVATTAGSAEPSSSTLPLLFLPGTNLNEPAGEYGWTGALGSTGVMHRVISMGGNEYRATQLFFAVENDCFAAGEDPVPVTVAGLDGLYVGPYGVSVLAEDETFPLSSRTFSHPRGGETQEAYALRVGDRTLCVYLTWDPGTTEEELAAGRQIVGSIRGQPNGENGIRINFTLPEHWDTG